MPRPSRASSFFFDSKWWGKARSAAEFSPGTPASLDGVEFETGLL